jgi:1-aminocyclopropane-1-carboxylate deaminase
MLYSSELMMPSRLQRLQGAVWQSRGIQVFMKREDERDPLLGGNKWCKLQGHIEAAYVQGARQLLSVGGVWSNHLHALAHAGQRFGFKTIGIVRGQPECMTATLDEVQAAGMLLRFVSREEYRLRHEPAWQSHVCAAAGGALFIPEGGAGAKALPGLQRLAREISAQMQGGFCLAVPVGSGTTLAGLRRALPAHVELLGFQAFADTGVSARIEALSGSHSGWRLQSTQAMRQHAKLPVPLADFMRSFFHEENIELDSVYTVRMMARLAQMIVEGEVPDASRLVCLHSGGLQGRRGHAPALAA